MKIAAITPTRGDRPEFLEHCKYLMEQQIRKPDKHYIIDYPPENDEVDLITRIRKGIEMAKADGMDYVAIIEDDDYYPEHYFETLEDVFTDTNILFTGSGTTIYYHLGFQAYREMWHPARSSLFTTAFKIDALNDFKWPSLIEPFLDLHLWNFAMAHHETCVIHGSFKCIGIKHGLGTCGGNGHYMDKIWYPGTNIPNLLKDMDSKSLSFYTKMSELCTPSK